MHNRNIILQLIKEYVDKIRAFACNKYELCMRELYQVFFSKFGGQIYNRKTSIQSQLNNDVIEHEHPTTPHRIRCGQRVMCYQRLYANVTEDIWSYLKGIRRIPLYILYTITMQRNCAKIQVRYWRYNDMNFNCFQKIVI